MEALLFLPQSLLLLLCIRITSEIASQSDFVWKFNSLTRRKWKRLGSVSECEQENNKLELWTCGWWMEEEVESFVFLRKVCPLQFFIRCLLGMAIRTLSGLSLYSYTEVELHCELWLNIVALCSLAVAVPARHITRLWLGTRRSEGIVCLPLSLFLWRSR